MLLEYSYILEGRTEYQSKAYARASKSLSIYSVIKYIHVLYIVVALKYLGKYNANCLSAIDSQHLRRWVEVSLRKGCFSLVI
jgi:hypothetical protein